MRVPQKIYGNMALIGDSLINLGDGKAQWPKIGIASTLGKVRLSWDKSLAGQTVQQAIDGQVAGVVSNNPDCCTVLLGTNDTGSGSSTQSISSDFEKLKELWDSLVSQNIGVIPCTIPPNTGFESNVIEWNNLIVTECSQRHWKYFDLNSFAGDGDAIKSEYDLGDQTHFSVEGNQRLGEAFGAFLLANGSLGYYTKIAEKYDKDNLFSNPFSHVVDANGVPKGFVYDLPAGSTVELVDPPAGGVGNYQRVSVPAGESGEHKIQHILSSQTDKYLESALRLRILRSSGATIRHRQDGGAFGNPVEFGRFSNPCDIVIQSEHRAFNYDGPETDSITELLIENLGQATDDFVFEFGQIKLTERPAT